MEECMDVLIHGCMGGCISRMIYYLSDRLWDTFTYNAFNNTIRETKP
jgi:hypothetical protein